MIIVITLIIIKIKVNNSRSSKITKSQLNEHPQKIKTRMTTPILLLSVIVTRFCFCFSKIVLINALRCSLAGMI
jgi:uncharacterized membrane protein